MAQQLEHEISQPRKAGTLAAISSYFIQVELMIQVNLLIFSVVFFLVGCKDDKIKENSSKYDEALSSTTMYKPKLSGKWERRYPNKDKSIIEIKDTASALVYSFNSSGKVSDTLFSTMGFFNDTTIWISVPTARFDFRIKGDTLIEFDKMGIQGKFIKVK